MFYLFIDPADQGHYSNNIHYIRRSSYGLLEETLHHNIPHYVTKHSRGYTPTATKGSSLRKSRSLIDMTPSRASVLQVLEESQPYYTKYTFARCGKQTSIITRSTMIIRACSLCDDNESMLFFDELLPTITAVSKQFNKALTSST